ncbi:hypothetical protein ACPC54_33860 [Kitasatospora sp. NPDC094028]
MNEHRSPSTPASTGTALLHRPADTVASAVRRVPGADAVGDVVNGVLDTIGLVSPRARRIAAYTGAGLLGALGAVDWPVAAVGAAAVWLTQPRPLHADSATSAPKAASAGTKRTAAPSGAKRSTTAAKKAKTARRTATPAARKAA